MEGRRVSLGLLSLASTLTFTSVCFLLAPLDAALGGETPASQPKKALASDETEASLPWGDGTELLERMQTAFATLVDRVGPAVVAIQADRHPSSLGERAGWAPRSWVSTGTGIIIRPDGMILTSQHVIDQAVAIHVVLHDGRRLRAQRIAADRRSDLAMLRVKAENLSAATLSDVKHVRRGHFVLALGNPLGLSSDGQAAVSHGLVSAIGRPLPEAFGLEEDRYYGDMIQTTAPINPGNSGGPLIDMHGRVIGIVTAVSTRSDGREGVGFAVPINAHTKTIIEKLLHGKQVEYGYLGVQVDRVSSRLRHAAGLSDGRGVMVDSTFADGPADRAGLRAGDIITAVDGEPVFGVERFIRVIGAAGVGQVVSLDYVRNGTAHQVKATLTRRPSSGPQELPEASFQFRGAAFGAVDPVMRSLSNLPEKALLVLSVDVGSPADQAGLMPGDVIIRVGGDALDDATMGRLASSQADVVFGLANGGSVLIKPE